MKGSYSTVCGLQIYQLWGGKELGLAKTTGSCVLAPPPVKKVHGLSAAERGENNLNGFKDFRTENCSSQGQNLALTGSFVPRSLDSGA